jgi:hypothetical protein
MNELLPCPFCNGENAYPWEGPNGWSVVCDNIDCAAEGPFDLGASGAVAKWNNRAALDTTQAQALLVGEEIATLQAEVTRLRAALEAVEWMFNDTGDFVGSDFCPWCNSCEKHGHSADCQRQVALGVNHE